MSKLGRAIQRARTEKGLSQAELAGKIGLYQPTISNWERGVSAPDEVQLKKLENALGPLSDTNQNEGAGAVAEWLKRARTKAGMSVTELSKVSNVSIPAIYAIEAGRIENPQQSTRNRLAKALSVSFSNEDAEVLREQNTVTGLGQFEEFDPHNSNEVPAVGGVYVFYDIAERPIYVGQSKNIRGRWKSHGEKFWFKRPIVETAAYIQIDNEQLRKQVEAILIKFLKSNAVINQSGVERE